MNVVKRKQTKSLALFDIKPANTDGNFELSQKLNLREQKSDTPVQSRKREKPQKNNTLVSLLQHLPPKRRKSGRRKKIPERALITAPINLAVFGQPSKEILEHIDTVQKNTVFKNTRTLRWFKQDGTPLKIPSLFMMMLSDWNG